VKNRKRPTVFIAPTYDIPENPECILGWNAIAQGYYPKGYISFEGTKEQAIDWARKQGAKRINIWDIDASDYALIA